MTAEKKDMLEEAQRTINLIRQMEASLEGSRSQQRYSVEDDDLRITFPLTRCLSKLKEKHTQISKLHRERFEQVKSKLITGEYQDKKINPY